MLVCSELKFMLNAAKQMHATKWLRLKIENLPNELKQRTLWVGSHLPCQERVFFKGENRKHMQKQKDI